MKILFDIHTHTRYSDAKGTVAENVAVARKKGLNVGISDHGPGHPWYGVRPKGLKSMRRDIDALLAQTNGDYGVILQGIEANLMDGKGATDLEGLPPLDYHLLGFHKGIFPKSAFSLEMGLLRLRNPEAARQRMTDALIAAMDDPRIDVITHPGTYIPVDMARLAQVAAHRGVVLELNQRHPSAPEDAQTACEAGAYFILSSDAHRSELVGEVPQPIAVAEAAGIPPQRIINAPEYDWNGGLRIDRLGDKLRCVPCR